VRSRLRTRASRALAALGAAVVLMGGLVPLLSAPPASAATNGEWSIFPYRPPGTFGSGRGIFDYSMRPGQTITDAATITNFTNSPLDFYIYPADAYNVPVGGGFALRDRSEPRRQVGAWITLPNSLNTIYTVPARTSANLGFQITAPLNAAPGDHAGGIVALDVTPLTEIQGHTRVNLHRGVGVRVYVDILGPRHPGLNVTNIQSRDSVPALAWANGNSNAYPTFQVQDSGNTIFNAVEAKLWATNVFGRTVKTYPDRFLEGMLPGNKVTVYEKKWNSLPVAGPITLHVKLVAQGINQDFSNTFWIVPWLLILIIVVVLVLLFLAWRWRRRRRERAEQFEPEPQPPVTTAVG
jgi:hypothetical protein